MPPVFRTCIDSLPNEVLIQVFASLISDYASEGRRYHAAVHFVCEARTILRLISQSWNNIVVSTCGLWSRIEIYGYHRKFGRHCYNPPIHVIKLWLQRSGEMRLNLDLDLTRDCDIMEEYIEELFDVLWPLSHQWGTLRLDLHGTWENVFVHRPIPTVGLKAVVMLSAALPKDDQDGPSIIEALAKAPNLCCLTWRHLSDSSARSMATSFPLFQLTRLDLSAVIIGFKSIVDIFRQANQATWISLQSSAMTYETSVVNLSRLDLPSLRVLKLDVPTPDLNRILHLLNCPCLQVLCISSAMSGHYEPNTTAAVTGFVSDIGQSLQILQFTRWPHVGATELFKNPMFLRIPVMTAQINWAGDATRLLNTLKIFTDGMWEGFSDVCKIVVDNGYPRSVPGWVKKVVEDTGFSLSFRVAMSIGAPCLVMGWVDPGVLPLFGECFADGRTGLIPELFLSTDGTIRLADIARDWSQ